MSHLFTSDDQNAGASVLASVNSQGWSPLRLTGLISLLSKGLSGRSLLQHHSSKASILWCSAFFTVQFSQPYVTTGKTIALTIGTCVGTVMPLIFNTLSTFVITFLPRSNHLISWLQSSPSVILEPKKRKSVTTSTFSPSICHAELPDVQAGFRKGRGTRDQIANILCIMEKAREFQKKHLFLLYWLCQSLWLCG